MVKGERPTAEIQKRPDGPARAASHEPLTQFKCGVEQVCVHLTRGTEERTSFVTNQKPKLRVPMNFKKRVRN